MSEIKSEKAVDLAVIKGESEIRRMIYNVRNQQVMLDSDLASLYHVETKRLNERVRRNRNLCETCIYYYRQNLRCQIGISRCMRNVMDNEIKTVESAEIQTDTMSIRDIIYIVRGKQVLLDSDLAAI